MIFKEDWDLCRKRLEAFWEGEIIDRCCISVLAPRNKVLDTKNETIWFERDGLYE